MYNKDNFFKGTYAVWKEKPFYGKINLDYPDYTSESFSKYYYTKKGVYRLSSHWDNVGSCVWKIKGDIPNNKSILLFCKWSKFLEIKVCDTKRDFIELCKNSKTRFLLFGNKYKIKDIKIATVYDNNGLLTREVVNDTSLTGEPFVFVSELHKNHFGNEYIDYIIKK